MDDVPRIPDREITPPELYFNRRSFLRAGAVAASIAATGSLYRWFNPVVAQTSRFPPSRICNGPASRSKNSCIEAGPWKNR